jgi:hypothetical protein
MKNDFGCCRCFRIIEHSGFGKFRLNLPPDIDLEITVEFLVKFRIRIDVLKIILVFFESDAIDLIHRMRLTGFSNFCFPP